MKTEAVLPDRIPDGIFFAPSVGIEALNHPDLASYRRVICDGILGMPYMPLAQKQEQSGKRTEEYFNSALSNPDKFTLLAARNDAGEVIGGLEAAFVTMDGREVGYVHWVCVDPESRGSGVGVKLYERYEEILRERGDIFCIMAHVDNENTPSLRLHERMGVKEVFSEDENGKWYYKPL